MTESFGRRLKRERERRDVTVESIAARTKIKASLFEELERDDASHWPAGIFRRSFIRAYAEAVGADVEETVREFLERFPDPADAPLPDVPVALAKSLTPGQGGDTAGPRRDLAPASLRLTLVETGLPFAGGRLLADVRRRWSAAAWDAGSISAVALSIFIVIDSFWRPLGVVALCYYVGGILLLGNSPGVCLFAPRPSDDGDNPPKPSRVPRHRPTAEPVPMRTGEASLRAVRFRSRLPN
jgi:transcriptional regulator with XRE-family HTH domain